METTEKKFGSLEDFENKVAGKAPEAPSEQPPEQPPEDVGEEKAGGEEKLSSEETVKKEDEPVSKDKKDEEEAVPPGGEQIKEESKTSFDINEINKRFGTEFADEDSLKAALNTQETEGLKTKMTDLEKQVAELEAVKEENAMLRENLDPLKYFASDDDFKIAQFKKQFPDKDASVAYQLFTEDLKSVPDQEMLAYEMMLDTPGLTREDALGVVRAEYGIDDEEGPDRVQSARMKINATKARKSVDGLKSEIKLPDKVDVDSLSAEQRELREQKSQRLTDGWKNIGNEIARSLDDVIITDTVDGKEQEIFRYAIDKDFPQDVVESVANVMAQSGVEPSKEAAASAAQVFKEKYVSQNLNKMLKAAMDHVKTKAEEERLKKQHNPGSVKPETPSSGDKEDYDSKLLAGLNKGWQPTKPFGN